MDQNHFRIKMDVKQFAPEDLVVKMKDNHLVIEGKHEEKIENEGLVTRQFVRRFSLPPNLNKDLFTSSFSSDGILEVSAPLNLEDESKEQHIPIVFKNTPAAIK